jgi:hypothetical protein
MLAEFWVGLWVYISWLILLEDFVVRSSVERLFLVLNLESADLENIERLLLSPILDKFFIV